MWGDKSLQRGVGASPKTRPGGMRRKTWRRTETTSNVYFTINQPLGCVVPSTGLHPPNGPIEIYPTLPHFLFNKAKNYNYAYLLIEGGDPKNLSRPGVMERCSQKDWGSVSDWDTLRSKRIHTSRQKEERQKEIIRVACRRLVSKAAQIKEDGLVL